MTLRLATPEDFDDIFRMSKQFYEASPFTDCVFDPDKVASVIHNFITDKNDKIAILLVDPHPVGMLLALTTESLFSYEKIAGEIVFWIDPDHRTFKNARQLVEAYKYWVNLVGASTANLVCLDPKHGKLYQRLGFTPVEYVYRMK